MEIKNSYDQISWLYNALSGDKNKDELINSSFIETHRELLESYTTETARIIDAACGNGVQAVSLALNGYNITATDASLEMVKLTVELALKNGAALNTGIETWIQLGEKYEGTFDIVFCTGNSIVHSENKNIRAENIRSLSKALKPGGTLVIETRNWEKLINTHSLYDPQDLTSYADKNYLPLYRWNLNGIEKKSSVSILLQEIENTGKVTLYESALSFTPFTYTSLTDMMKHSQLDITKTTYAEDQDWYYVYGKKNS